MTQGRDGEAARRASGSGGQDRVLLPEHITDARDLHAVARVTAIVRGRVRRFVSRSSHGAGEVEDLVQEIWLALLEHDARRLRAWDRARGVPLEHFVAMLADRQLRSWSAHRRARRRSAPLVELDAIPEDTVVDHWPPETAAETSALLTRWRARVDRELPTRGRMIFELMVKELDPDQIATALEVNRQVVYNWQYQIRSMLCEAPGAARGRRRIRQRPPLAFPYSNVLARSG